GRLTLNVVGNKMIKIILKISVLFSISIMNIYSWSNNITFKLEAKAVKVKPECNSIEEINSDSNCLEKKIIFSNKDIFLMDKIKKTKHYRGEDQGTVKYSIVIIFYDESAKVFSNFTANNINKRLAVLVNGRVLVAPNITSKIENGTVMIESTNDDPLNALVTPYESKNLSQIDKKFIDKMINHINTKIQYDELDVENYKDKAYLYYLSGDYLNSSNEMKRSSFINKYSKKAENMTLNELATEYENIIIHRTNDLEYILKILKSDITEQSKKESILEFVQDNTSFYHEKKAILQNIFSDEKRKGQLEQNFSTNKKLINSLNRLRELIQNNLPIIEKYFEQTFYKELIMKYY
ncbi:MAG: hypothetical protein KDC52_12960, partial [Ignavibacteriae bacterium]|nr:hypothetical protein [Ignavibacteriota bacterium]